MITIILLVGFLIGVVITLLIKSYSKLKHQTKLLVMQGREINKQILELQEQNKLLEELNIEKQQIIGVVSHDLKGPFNRIFALAQLMTLGSDNFTEEQKEYLGKIHQIIADGLGMVRNLLDNRRLEDKQIDVTPEKLDLTVVISSLVKNYRLVAQKKKTQIHFEGPEHLYLTADKMLLNRIMDNLVSNGLKFSPPEKNIFVSIREIDNLVEIKVRDEGPGLSQDDQLHLFQKYRRLTPRPTGGESSTGLGLYLVQAMVTKMGGEVFCQSEEHHGAEFTIRLKKSIDAAVIPGIN